MSIKVVVALSGGLDSAVVLAAAVKAYGADAVQAVNLKYPSKHSAWEGVAARNVARHFGVKLSVVSFEAAFAGMSFASQGTDSSLFLAGAAVPEGHYQEESMRSTVVPGRNLLFASALAAVAETYARRQKATPQDQVLIGLGVHQGDHYIYPDCRPAFVAALRLTVQASSENLVDVWTPLLEVNKVQVVKAGADLGVPFHLTRTCYTVNETACGRCGSCQERLEAFDTNGMTDPIKYQKGAA